MSECSTCSQYLSPEDMIRSSVRCSANGSVSIIGALLNQIPEEYTAYLERVAADSGLVKSESNTLKLIDHLVDQGRFDDLKVAWIAESGYKKRVDTIFQYATKLYSISLAANDLVEATTGSQPYIGGMIAANDMMSLINSVGLIRTMTHPNVAFTAAEAWSAVYIVNWDGSLPTTAYMGLITGVSVNSYIGFRRSGVNRFFVRNIDSSAASGASGGTNNIIGVNTVLHFIALADGTVKVYKNGVLFESITVASGFTFNSLMSASTGSFFGRIFGYIIQAGAKSQAEITADYNLLRSIIPDNTTVLIGSKLYALNNLSIVSTINGTLIPDGILDANWDDGTIFQCTHTSSVGLSGKMYNKAGRDAIILNPPSGYRIPIEAELTALAALGGNALKVSGTDYWTTANGTNTTGFSATGAGNRLAVGTMQNWKSEVTYWCADSDKVLRIADDGTAEVIAANANDGHYIRLIKDVTVLLDGEGAPILDESGNYIYTE